MTQAPATTAAPISPAGWLRIALRCIGMTFWLCVSVPLWLIYRPFTRHNPAPRIFMAGICRILGIRLDVCGSRVTKGALLLPNHVSWMDVPALTGLTGTAFVAHDGLAGNRWLRWLCELNDTVFVARHDRTSIATQVEQVRKAISETGALTVFAEGTTGDGVEMLPFKSSLLSAACPVPDGVSVQPMWLDYGPDVPEIAWVGDEPGLANFLRVAARSRPIRLSAHFLPPLAGPELGDRKTIAVAAREAIALRMLERTDAGDQRLAL